MKQESIYGFDAVFTQFLQAIYRLSTVNFCTYPQVL